MRASFLISRRKPWRGQLLLMARSKALPLLLKLYRRTPIFRPRHLQRRIPICSRGPDGVGRTNPPTDDIALSCRISKSISLGGLVQLDVSGEDEEEFVEDEDILQDLQDLRRQGNLELALMAGEQLEMDSEEDGELDDYDDYWDREGYMQYVAFAECGGEDDRLQEWVERDLGTEDTHGTMKALRLDSDGLGSSTKRGNVAV